MTPVSRDEMNLRSSFSSGVPFMKTERPSINSLKLTPFVLGLVSKAENSLVRKTSSKGEECKIRRKVY